jgi:hypothetical protein
MVDGVNLKFKGNNDQDFDLKSKVLVGITKGYLPNPFYTSCWKYPVISATVSRTGLFTQQGLYSIEISYSTAGCNTLVSLLPKY